MSIEIGLYFVNIAVPEHPLFLDGLKQPESNQDWWGELTTRQEQIIHEGVTDAENDNLISSSEFWKSLKDG